MATPHHVSRRAFLSSLRRSGLFSPEQLARARALAPDTDRGRLIARALVEEGLLTRFQAERLLVGRTDGFVLDQYVILAEVGRGGMGRVYRARHRTMDRVVALKVLAPALTRAERACELFLREVRAAARLVHPNIVTAFDASRSGDRYYLVLEYVDGPNLEQLVREQGPLAVGQACDFVRQAAHGLQCAHHTGLVHRDIKPANLLLQLRGQAGAAGLVKVSDFGLARLQDREVEDRPGTIVTRPNTVMGTPDFLSPEQARNLHDTDIRSDLYSLGCTFYFLLTGEVPFPGGTSLEKLIRHNTEEPEPVERRRPEVPPEVVAVVRRLMAKAPGQRFQAPAELARALEPFSASGPTPWEGKRAAEPLPELDTPPPPRVLSQDSDPLLPAGGSALEETSASAQGLTPLTGGAFTPLPVRRRARWKRALAWALFAAGGLAGLAAALGAFRGG